MRETKLAGDLPNLSLLFRRDLVVGRGDSEQAIEHLVALDVGRDGAKLARDQEVFGSPEQAVLSLGELHDQHGLLVHDARFHEIIVEGAGNTVLLDCWSGLRIEAYTLVSMIKSHLDLIAIANAHLPILDALRQRDGSLAGKVMREHIEHFASSLFGDEPDE